MTTSASTKAKSVAEDMPEGSVVATDVKALFKAYPDWQRPWLSTAGGSATNEDVDYYLATGAQVLRRGKTEVITPKPKVTPEVNPQTSGGSKTLDRLVERLTVRPSPQDLQDKLAPEIRNRPPASENTDIDRDKIKIWKEARLNDESHLTEDELLSGVALCSIKSPHNAHTWGRTKKISCNGYARDPQGLSFGSVVSEVTKTGEVYNWVKMSDNGNYPWRSPDGRTHGHSAVVKEVKKGNYTIIRWGI